MSVIFRSRYGVLPSRAMVQSSSFCRVARPRRPGTRPSTARKGDTASDMDTTRTLTARRWRHAQERRWLAPAVHGEVGTGDEGGLRRREKQARGRDVLWLDQAAHRHRGTDGRDAGGVAVVKAGLLCLEVADRDEVDPHLR